MGEPVIRIFATAVLVASAVYVVATNLNFRRQWPAMVERSRRRLAGQLDVDALLAGIETRRGLKVIAASCGGATAGAIAGVLLNIALMVLSAPPRHDHGLLLGVVGAAFGALAFAILAAEE
ncbi:MAG: hypothetical protein JO029_09035 [Candidatus Eremiobacteraeota bacterium]|nr:hypothetical protein [Candidatus Eremiobacteraeota bacterium]MBV8284085.1 hypothetical protein [Candidatus Eremiobacteraeota bacterium]MBV8434412.1 hypothetical protein [Candidatus Eremiobacteraeota bacterium]MBV8583848.1 hypothetical protein [Candidatus Eremiobacteraeota bacterium]MBV8654878.1 hypothetical protein [Candidatus Eremiobacteraeota bacterium]